MNDLTKVKKAIILAGGQKTRLNPFDPPKADCPIWMFLIINRPLIFFTINLLKENGIEEVMIAMSENDKIPHRLKEYNSPSINLHFHKKDRPRGTAGVLRDIEAFIGEEPFLVINSNLFVGRMDLAEFIRFHIERDSIATVGVYRDSNNGIEEGITLASDKTIMGFHRIHSSIDKRSPWRPSGIYIFNPSVLKFIDQNSYMDIMDIKEQLIPVLQKKALSVSACEIEGFHMCFNSINDYINLHRYLFLKSGYIDYLEDREEIAKGVWAGKDAKISSKAYLLGPIIIGDGCKIKDRAQIIGPAVIGNGCQISEGVLVRESVLWDGVSLSDGTKIEYSIIGEGSNILNIII